VTAQTTVPRQIYRPGAGFLDGALDERCQQQEEDGAGRPGQSGLEGAVSEDLLQVEGDEEEHREHEGGGEELPEASGDQ